MRDLTPETAPILIAFFVAVAVMMAVAVLLPGLLKTWWLERYLTPEEKQARKKQRESAGSGCGELAGCVAGAIALAAVAGIIWVAISAVRWSWEHPLF
jgi:ABC-type Fe3+ transport system permease subunit